MIYVPNPSEISLLSAALGLSAPGNQLLKLYTNVVTLGDATIASDLTEMSTLGYAAKTLAKGSWSVVTTNNVATASYAAQTWSFSAGSPVTVQGYFVVDATSGLLLWAEAFTTAKVVQYAGDQITITPQLTLSKA